QSLPAGLQPDAQKKSLHASEQQRPDIAAARENWRAEQPDLDPERLVFIDETWATTNMARRHGRAPRGQRLVAAIPHGHWKTSYFREAEKCPPQTRPSSPGCAPAASPLH